ncbi:hypothetical protein [Streptomyces sp. NBC_01497]|uniref:hypothetical protein n=1 Tax=Streptomyces sp. NBC_01497 TaxID=2903885 RepID=UPI002E30BC09|nr:hypothetical protein [Streptomyces sp. NBC_01497]
MTNNNSKIGMALVGGYFLGRTKKAKMAIGLGMFLAGKKLNLDPKQLGSMLTNSNLLGGLNDQVRKELLDTTKSAATAALTKRIGGFADSLHERTLSLDGRDEDEGAGDRDDDQDDRADEQADEDDDRAPRDDRDDDDRAPRDDSDDGDDDGPAPAGKPKTRRSASSSEGDGPKGSAKPKVSTPRKTASSTRTRVSGSAKKTASGGAHKTASSASSTRKTTSGARKTASSARKTTSGSARKAGNRGGSDNG